MKFNDRQDAAIHLAEKLVRQAEFLHQDTDDLIVFSIPRGGVILGDIVARTLHCTHEILIVKKIGFPNHEELAIGAITEDGILHLDSRIIAEYELLADDIEESTLKARLKVQQQVNLFRTHKRLSAVNKTVILVDDGVATGETIKAAIRCLRREVGQTQKIIVAVPVSSANTLVELSHLADKVICLVAPIDFVAVGQYYREFEPVSDKEVQEILKAQEARNLYPSHN